MAYTEARKRANAKWNSAHAAEYDRVVILLPRNDKDMKGKIKAAAADEGLTVSQFVLKLLEEKLG